MHRVMLFVVLVFCLGSLRSAAQCSTAFAGIWNGTFTKDQGYRVVKSKVSLTFTGQGKDKNHLTCEFHYSEISTGDKDITIPQEVECGLYAGDNSYFFSYNGVINLKRYSRTCAGSFIFKLTSEEGQETIVGTFVPDDEKYADRHDAFLVTLSKDAPLQALARRASTAQASNGTSAAASTAATATATDHSDMLILYNVSGLKQHTPPCEWDTTLYYYQTMVGILAELSGYRARFLTTHMAIDLFPTSYYHTTFSELEKIRNGEFHYSVNKMKQMLRFYDAYKYNRTNWDNKLKDKVDFHWLQHFTTANIFDLCGFFGSVMQTGIDAHVKCDLGRALRVAGNESYPTRLSAAQYDQQMHEEFNATNDIFEKTARATISDIAAMSWCTEWVSTKGQSISDFFGAGVDEVKTEREKAWQKAFTSKTLMGLNFQPLKPQPPTYRASLQKIGQQHVPDEKQNEGSALLFSNVRAHSNANFGDEKRVKNPLSVCQMDAIFNDTKWKVSADKKGLVIDASCEPEDPMVELLDLNGDGKMEVVLLYGGTCLAGNTATGFLLYTANKSGDYYRCMDEVGMLLPLKTKTNGYYDIELGGPGFKFPIYKWNGTKYMVR